MIKKGKYVIIDVVEKKVIMNKYLKNFYNLYTRDGIQSSEPYAAREEAMKWPA